MAQENKYNIAGELNKGTNFKIIIQTRDGEFAEFGKELLSQLINFSISLSVDEKKAVFRAINEGRLYKDSLMELAGIYLEEISKFTELSVTMHKDTLKLISKQEGEIRFLDDLKGFLKKINIQSRDL